MTAMATAVSHARADQPGAAASQPSGRVTSQGTAAVITAIGPGEPGNGAVCMTPSCGQRDTRKYGLRSLPLCTSCVASLVDEVYQRPMTAAQARAIGGTAA